VVYHKKTGEENYLEHSVRIDGRTRKISKYIGRGNFPDKQIEDEKKKYKDYFKTESFFIKFRERAKKYNLKFLDSREVGYLEFIKTAYNDWLKSIFPSETEKFEEIIYTKYVFNSTAIEGNTLTLEQTSLVLNENISPKGKSLREIHEVANYKDLLNFISKYKGDINRKFIQNLNRYVLKNIKDECAGMYRNVPAMILGTEFTPLPPPFIESEMNKLIRWYNDEKEKTYPLELACIFHQKFEEIHPFSDGNGRVGRELFRFILKKYKFPPLFFKVQDREEYLLALKEGNNANHKPLMSLAINSLKDDFKSLFINPEKEKEIKKIFNEKFGIKERQQTLSEY